jgi:glycine/D-amino acid oxidase-like deaminating enzyme
VAKGYQIHDRVIFGAGVFGLHAASLLLARGLRVAIVDIANRPLTRASLINQARVHNGYHYPRSAYTALRSAHYYERFVKDFPRAINRQFRAVYAIAAEGTYASATDFERFCSTVGVPARRIDDSGLFLPGSVEAAYETDEYSFDAPALRAELLARLQEHEHNLEWFMNDSVARGWRDGESWRMRLQSGALLETRGIVNATYAGTNALLTLFDLEPVSFKYELCEVVVVDAPALDHLAITVMDGPFFSLMPFGHSGLQTLTSVDYTPRAVSREVLPTFSCQERNSSCKSRALADCGTCPVRPTSSYPYMQALTNRFLRLASRVRKVESLNSIKVVMRNAEVDDARPTLVRVSSEHPLFITVFGGKISTIYDLDGAL